MQTLRFPNYQFRLKSSENSRLIFDPIRKKFVVLTPEEWVRQHTVQYLLLEKNYPQGLMNVEKKVVVNGMNKRYDILGYNRDGTIQLIVECKAPKVKITQASFDQIARYNLSLRAEYLMVTNGLQHYYCQLNYTCERYDFLPSLPDYIMQ